MNKRAFPGIRIEESKSPYAPSTKVYFEGMALRDYFAAKAMQGFIISQTDDDPADPYDHAELAYFYADIMLEERSKP